MGAPSLPGVVAGARTPEELETLVEDAFLMRDLDEVSALFHEGAVLVPSAGGPEARGGEAISHAVAALWGNGRTYVGGSRRVLQARDTALVVTDVGVHVARRAADGRWRVAISLLDLEHTTKQEEKT
jgi:ketosteroid isomerase-like protein